MSNIYFMCDNCGIETNGFTFVNGMKFCAKCYHQIFGKDNQQTEITQLKQQLAEKQNTINEINKEFVQAVHDWKTLCAEKDKEIKKLNWQLKDKDFIIKNLNHSLSVTPNANAGQRARIDELTKIVKEKDKEIEKLNKTLEMCKHIERYDIGEMFLENAKLIIEKRQFAIQELEKVKILLQNAVNYEGCDFVRVYDAVNNQIKKLKGDTMK